MLPLKSHGFASNIIDLFTATSIAVAPLRGNRCDIPSRRPWFSQVPLYFIYFPTSHNSSCVNRAPRRNPDPARLKTAGRSMEEIGETFASSKNIFDLVKVSSRKLCSKKWSLGYPYRVRQRLTASRAGREEVAAQAPVGVFGGKWQGRPECISSGRGSGAGHALEGVAKGKVLFCWPPRELSVGSLFSTRYA